MLGPQADELPGIVDACVGVRGLWPLARGRGPAGEGGAGAGADGEGAARHLAGAADGLLVWTGLDAHRADRPHGLPAQSDDAGQLPGHHHRWHQPHRAGGQRAQPLPGHQRLRDTEHQRSTRAGAATGAAGHHRRHHQQRLRHGGERHQRLEAPGLPGRYHLPLRRHRRVRAGRRPRADRRPGGGLRGRQRLVQRPAHLLGVHRRPRGVDWRQGLRRHQPAAAGRRPSHHRHPAGSHLPGGATPPIASREPS